MLVIREMVLFVFLGWEMIEDLRYRMIRMDVVMIFGVLGVVFRIVEKILVDRSLLWSVLPGLILLFIGKVTKHTIGEGDGWIFLVNGLYLDGLTNGKLCYLSFCLVTLWGIVQSTACKIKNKSCKMEYPFVPFVFLAFLVVLIWGG